MPTQARDLISTGVPSARTRQDFSPTGAGSLYTPPDRLLVPGAVPTPQPGITPSMPTTEIPEAWSPSGIFQGSSGYAFPNPRILAVPIQKLAGATDIYSTSHIITFPFVIRSLMMWVPASTIGASSDGTMEVRVGPDNTQTAAGFATGIPVTYPMAQQRPVYCPIPLSFGELWVPFSEAHMYIQVHAFSLGGATNVQLICLAGITPLDDYLGA